MLEWRYNFDSLGSCRGSGGKRNLNESLIIYLVSLNIWIFLNNKGFSYKITTMEELITETQILMREVFNMGKINALNELKAKISSTRAKMNALWEQRGYTDKDVLAVSIELDRLMNHYHQLVTKMKMNR